jgi:hypothetical protein
MTHLKTLVIHPDDRSTDFLRAVYAGIPNCKVMTRGTIWEVDLEIQAADRVIMLGHGTPSGLLSVGQFKGSFYCIDAESAQLLKSKKECIYIWCYASDFMKKHQLEGFGSGMFISEVAEATYCGLPRQSKKDIDLQCKYFCDLVGAGISLPTRQLYNFVNEEFGEAALGCKIARYNHERLHFA